MKCGVLVFPGSHGDHDVYYVLKHRLGLETYFLWHEDRTLRGCDLVVLPGGCSFGDRPRPGVVASRAPVMEAVATHAERGGLVLGIGNGFQILLEAGLLEGSVVVNPGGRFVCREVAVRVERADLPFTCRFRAGAVLALPIAHQIGRYEAPADGFDPGRVVLRYADDVVAGEVAGLTNAAGNVLGLMPHPERAAEPLLGRVDGLELLAGAVRGTEDPREVLA